MTTCTPQRNENFQILVASVNRNCVSKYWSFCFANSCEHLKCLRVGHDPLKQSSEDWWFCDFDSNRKLVKDTPSLSILIRTVDLEFVTTPTSSLLSTKRVYVNDAIKGHRCLSTRNRWTQYGWAFVESSLAFPQNRFLTNECADYICLSVGIGTIFDQGM